MQDDYVYMKNITCMLNNVYMQDNCINMQDGYVYMQDNDHSNEHSA